MGCSHCTGFVCVRHGWCAVQGMLSPPEPDVHSCSGMQSRPVCCCDAGPHIALDGDMLLQFLYLPNHLQQEMVVSMDYMMDISKPVSISLPNLLRVLEGALPVC